MENAPGSQRVKSDTWREEVMKLHIDISDFGEKALPITVLIGSDVAGKIWTGKRVQLKCGLIAIETLLGWTLTGKVPEWTERCDTTAVETSLCLHDEKIADLWSLEVLGIRDPVERTTHKEHEKKVWDSLLESTYINEEGRYKVQLPWKANHAALNDNRDLAKRRLESTIKKLKTEGYFTGYNQTLTEWKAEGICEEVPADEVNEWGHCLPHRHIIKENSTTRIRLVFDASAKDGKNPSLNQCLEKGPNMMELIASILIRFRLGAIGVIADIRKAFLQISIYPKDRDCLRFLWIDSDGNIVHMRHSRVVFDVTCSPFILGAVIDLHLRSVEDDKENAEKFLRSFHVDNCVASVNSKDELREFMKGAVTMMSGGGFDLRGWEFSGDRSDGVPTNVLGIGWNKEMDTLMLNMPVLHNIDQENITKRTILSLAQRVFDPLGFVCPVLLFPRLILREIWAEKKSWDEPVNENTKFKFLKRANEIGGLTEVKVRRCMMGSDVEEISLHTFCDASQSAYAAIIYLRVIKASGIDVYFVQSKNRLAPSKELTIPKLELTSATIGARLATSVLESLRLEKIETFFWSDSSTVLAWIRRDDHWDPYVWNRVREIRELIGAGRWFHVDGHSNPADLPSRGCTVKTLVASRWWEGPQWLRSPRSEWPVENLSYDEGAISKGRRKTVAVREGEVSSIVEVNAVSVPRTPHVPWYAKYFSKYNRILRLISWIRRFILNCKRRKGYQVAGNLVANEIIDAEIVLLRCIQNESFIGLKDKRLEKLVTYVDKNGLIRLNTKVTLREDTLDFRCPVVLPAEHVVVRLLIIYRHKNLSHARVQILLSNLREQYWILGGRKTLRAVLSKCVVCRRHDSVPFRAIPAPLPVDRVREAAIFEIVGTDFAGPVFLRGAIKAYICLFTCAVFRAVHLELVTSLTTASFLEALRRFIARRGKPTIIYSDNGKNFVGFNNFMRTIDEDKLRQFASARMIIWKFNPPTAAWWGGWWERLIGIMKRLLRKMLRNACLSYEEMCTVLCDCEAVVNSRPITFMSDGMQEFVPLTPSMFLQEIKEIGVPECDYLEKCKFGKKVPIPPKDS